MTARKRQAQRKLRTSRPGGSVVSDALFFLAAGALTMAGVFFVTSFSQESVIAGDAGRMLARSFAGALALTATFMALMGAGLIREERGRTDHYLAPIAIGIVAGGIGAALFLTGMGRLLWAPSLLVVLALRPVRRLLTGGGR